MDIIRFCETLGTGHSWIKETAWYWRGFWFRRSRGVRCEYCHVYILRRRPEKLNGSL